MAQSSFFGQSILDYNAVADKFENFNYDYTAMANKPCINGHKLLGGENTLQYLGITDFVTGCVTGVCERTTALEAVTTEHAQCLEALAECVDAKSTVTTSSTGTSTEVINYITVDGCEKLLPGGAAGVVNTVNNKGPVSGNVTVTGSDIAVGESCATLICDKIDAIDVSTTSLNNAVDNLSTSVESLATAVDCISSDVSALTTEVNNKSTVSVSSIGTATDEVCYITINGTQHKLAGGGSPGPGPAAGTVCSVNNVTPDSTGDVSLTGANISVATDDNTNLINYMKKLFTLPYLGRNWTQSTGGSTYRFGTVYYANSIWVAGSNYHGLWWSTDGKTWTQSTDGSTYRFITVYYADGIWVAGSDGHGLWWSTDGKTWTQGTDASSGSILSITGQTVYYANGIWVAGSDGHGLWWSTDGKTWTQGTGGASIYFDAVYYANGIWVAGSDTDGLWWSTDGKAWTQGTGGSSHSFLTIYYANGIWVASGDSRGIWWSTDGKAWTQSTDATFAYFYAFYYANGIWIAGSDDGLWWSVDGKTWTQSTDGTATNFNTVYYTNGIWVAGSDNHSLWWSVDGKTWAQSTDAASYTFYTIYYANGIWVAGSDSHGLWWSSIDNLDNFPLLDS